MENGAKEDEAGPDGPPLRLPGYLLALRPWSFSASLMPVLLGFALARQTGAACDFFVFLTTALTAVAVHGAGNVVNTYYDFVKGIDSTKSEDRTLVDRLVSQAELTCLGVVLYCVGCAGFVTLAVATPVRLEQLAIVYFGGLSGSFLYTGGIGLKYIALGDLLVLVIFGPVTTLFSFMVQTGGGGGVGWGTMLYAVPLALNAEAILHSNNTRDLEPDRRAGIVTLAILIGPTASELLFGLLLFAPFSLFFIWGVKYSPWLLLPLVTLPEAFGIERAFRAGARRRVPKRTAKLNFYMGFLYTLGVFLTPPHRLPFIRPFSP